MFITYVLRELRRRHRQAIAVALGLALGIGLVITVTAVSSGVKSAQDQVLHSLYGVGTDISVTQAATQGSGGPQRFGFSPGSRAQEGKAFSRDSLRPTRGLASIASSSVTSVKGLAHVAAAAGGLGLTDTQISGTFASSQGSGSRGGGGFGGGFQGSGSNALPSTPPISVNSFTVEGVDVTAADLGPLSSTQLSSGRMFTTADASAKVALVDSSYATQQSLKVGSSVNVAGTSVKVVGIVTAPSGDDSSNLYLPMAEAQSLANLSGKVTTIYVKADSASNIAAVRSEIQKKLPQATVTTSADVANEVSGSLSSASGLADNLGRWLSIAVLVAAFLLASLFTMSAVSRRVREFGTLKALGWRSRRVIGQVMAEAFAQGVLGGIVGILLGFGGAELVDKLAPKLTASLDPNTQAGGAAGSRFRGFGGYGYGGAGTGTAAGAGGRRGFGSALRTTADSVAVHLTAPVTLTAILAAVALAIAGGVIAGCFGGWRAARLRPAAALRRVE